MPLSKIMTLDPVTIRMDDTLATIRDIFSLVKFHHLMVIEDNKLVGIISDRDYLKAINSATLGTVIESNRDLAALNKKAHQIMTRKVISVNEKESVANTVLIFCTKNVSCIPVIDDHHSLVGVISWRDIMKALAINIQKKESKPHK